MSLSFGLEVEGVATSRASSGDPLPENTTQQLRLLVDALNDAGLNAQVYLASGTRSTGPDYRIWNVTYDITVEEVTSGSEAGSGAFRSRFGFEIISPVFAVGEGAVWVERINTAISAIHRVVKWKANRSTGLHVHVGRGRDISFNLDKVKKIAMFCCRFEAAMDEFHPQHRRTDNDNIYSNRNNDLIQHQSLQSVYQMIISTANVEEVCKIMNYSPGGAIYTGYSDSRFYKVNFTSLHKHGTIEFRQHEGTADAERMVTWIRFVLKMVNSAIHSPYEKVMAAGETFHDLKLFVDTV